MHLQPPVHASQAYFYHEAGLSVTRPLVYHRGTVSEMEQTRQESPHWGPVRRALFRLLFLYLVLYNFPSPLHTVPVYGEILRDSCREGWSAAVSWVGERLLGAEVLYRPSGSGDATYNYVLLFCYLILALAATAVWTLLDGRRANYALNAWLRVYVRFVLAAAMIVYGAYKVIPEQFGTPFPSELLQPVPA